MFFAPRIYPTSNGNSAINLPENNFLHSIRMQETGLFTTGISATSNIILGNVEIGTQTNSGNYATGITMNNSHALIANSAIYAYQSGAATADNQINAAGIQMTNGGSLIVTSSNGIANETK
jgi:hypothetical protein